MTDPIVPQPKVDVLQGVVAITQIAGALGVLALAAALIINFLTFLMIDLDLLFALTISDHVNTAIVTLPFVMALAAIGIWRSAKNSPATPADARFLWWSGLASISLALLLMWALGSPAKLAAAISMFMLLWIVAGDASIRYRLRSAQPTTILLARIASMALVMIVAYGIVGGAAIYADKPNHRVMLGNDTEIRGHLVQIVDRGVIMIAMPGNTPTFIPRDKIIRIETIAR